MSKLFRVTMAAGLIAVMLMALNGALVWAATPPEPTYGMAAIDGAYGEWNLTDDFFANLYRSGDPSKTVEGKLYLRYDCDNEILYALVLAVPGLYIDTTPAENWIKIYDIQNGSLVDGNSANFAWVIESGDTVGWEASVSLAAGWYNKLEVHTNVFDEGDFQTSSTGRTGWEIPLLLHCGDSCVIGDYVWHDADWEGDQDEPKATAGIPNISVALRDSTGGLIDLTETNSHGYYWFTVPCDGMYKIDVDENDQDMPAGYRLTTELTYGPDPMTVNLTGASYYDADFGYAAYETTLGAIGDLVWHDENESGDQNENEPGIPDTTLTLYRWGSWTQVGTTDTDYFGNYMFWDLEAGIYKVDVDENDVTAWFSPDDWSQTTDFEPMCVELGTISRRVDCGSVGSGSPAGGGGIRVLGTDVEDFLDADFGYLSEGAPTAVAFSSLAARSSVGGLASGLWPGLLGLAMLAAVSLFWAKRQARSVK